MDEKIEKLLRSAKDHKVEMIDLKFIDLLGQWHHLTIPAAIFSEETFSRGVAFDGSSVGFKTVEAGDMVLIPEPETARYDPL
ncbi:MAG: glutamine synthetase [Proteobacteria bacterium]|nr:glutamine synthetase [Pseudomonadota bacterium]